METIRAPRPAAGDAPAIRALCDTQERQAELLDRRWDDSPSPRSSGDCPSVRAPSHSPLRHSMAAPTLRLCVLDVSDPRNLAAPARAGLDLAASSSPSGRVGRGAVSYGADAHRAFRHRRPECRPHPSPLRTLQFAPAVVNETLSRTSDGGPTRAAATLAAVLAGTVGHQMRLDLGLLDPGGFGNNEAAAEGAAARTSQEVASVLDAVGRADSANPADVGFKTRVAEEMHAWQEALAEQVRRRASASAPAASVAAAGLAVACAWAASMRGHPETVGLAVAHWRKHGEASACLVAAGAFGALEEPTEQLCTAWAAHGLAIGHARAAFRDVSRVVAAALAPAFADGVALCGEHAVLYAAARAAAFVVATSEYLATRTESMLIMFAVPRPAHKRKRAADNHATLPADDGFAADVLTMCSDLAAHPTRTDVCTWAKDALAALESSVKHYLRHASTQRGGVPFDRLALADLCAVVLSNPRPPRQDARLAKWHALACQTVSRLRLVRPPTAEEEQRVKPHRLLDERRRARLVDTEEAHRSIVEQPESQRAWAAALGESWKTHFERLANAKAATDRFAAAADNESEQQGAFRAGTHAAARADANSAVEGNDSATRMWAVSNVAYAAMRYLVFGEAPYLLAAAPLDARVVVCRGGSALGAPVREKRMATWVTVYPAAFA